MTLKCRGIGLVGLHVGAEAEIGTNALDGVKPRLLVLCGIVDRAVGTKNGGSIGGGNDTSSDSGDTQTGDVTDTGSKPSVVLPDDANDDTSFDNVVEF